MKYESFESTVPTAILTAYPRIFTDIPYSNEIYQELEKRMIITDDLKNQLLAVELEARYKLMDKILLNLGVKQIVEIAAGYSQRGLIFSKIGINYIEFDLKEVIELKKEILSSIAKIPSNLNFVYGNALNIKDLKKCEKYINKKEPIAFINEGLLRYFTFEEKRQIGLNIIYFLKEYGGAWITCDVTPKRFLISQNATNPILNPNMSKITSRNSINDRFEDENHIKTFYGEIGLDVEIHYFSEVKDELSSPNKLNLTDIDERLNSALVAIFRLKK